MLRRILLALALLATGEAAKAKADPKECEVCIANLEAIDKLIDKDEKTSKQSIMEAITKQAARVNNSHFTIAPCAPREKLKLVSRADRLAPTGGPRRFCCPGARLLGARGGDGARRHTNSRVHANNNTRRRRHCGDLQNEQPNPALNARDRKMCYYFEPIRAAIAQPFSTRMPKDRVCKRLKQSNGEICNVKYQVQVDNNLSDEEMLAQLKKKRVKELKGILNDRGVKCEGCLEKDDFIKKIMATNGMSTDF